MAWYVGLTDDPQRRRAEHGNPPDWHEFPFATEGEARAWEASEVNKPGHQGAPGGAGWRFGYWYTITASTKQ